MRKEDCLFCKIVAGEIPSAKVYEDDRILELRIATPQIIRNYAAFLQVCVWALCVACCGGARQRA